MPNMIYGAHVSSAGGLKESLLRGQKLGVNAIQTFVGSPRSINFVAPSDQAIKDYLTYLPLSGIKCHLFHGVYLINLAHEDKKYVDLCINSLLGYQRTAAAINGLGTVFHVGSHKGKGLPAVLDSITTSISKVLQNSPQGPFLMLEMAAGQKGTIGQSLTELKMIIDAVVNTGIDTTSLGLCLDTQHAFASGYDLSSEKGVDTLFNELTSLQLITRVKAIHVNDSQTPFHSNKDRHANLGAGLIGFTGLKKFVSHHFFATLPQFLEVPGENKTGPNREQVDILKSMYE